MRLLSSSATQIAAKCTHFSISAVSPDTTPNPAVVTPTVNYKKLRYRRGTAQRAMLVNSCYVSRGMKEWFRTAKVTFKVIQQHWQWRYSIGHVQFSISVPLQLCLYLAPLTIYYHLFRKI